MANWVAEYLAANPELADLPVERRHKYGITLRRPDGQSETHFTGKPCHYEAAPGDWRPIDTAIQNLGTHYGAPGVPVRLQLDGTSSIEGGSYSQRTTRVGLFRPSTKAFTVVRNIPVGRAIDGDRLIAQGDFWKHEITLTENGVREELTLLSQPPAPAGTKGSDWLVLETLVTGVSFPEGWLDEFDADGMHFSLPSAHDANGDEPDTKRYARTVAGKQYIYTGIPVSWLANAVYPVVIDPDYAGDTADVHIRGGNATYATARTTSSDFVDIGEVQVGQTTGYHIRRIYLKFLTAGIPDGDTVTQVNLELVCTFDDSLTDFDVNIIQADWSGQDPITSGNREAAYDLGLSSSEDSGSPWRNTLGMSINTVYTSPNLDTSWVVKNGPTYYALVSHLDYDGSGSQPTNSQRIYIASQDNATSSYRPVLVVVHAAAGNDLIDGTLTSASTLTATLKGTGLVDGLLTSASTLAATLKGLGKLFGTLTSASTISGDLDAMGKLVGTLASASTLAATIKAKGVLVGILTGSSTIGGTITDSSVGVSAGRGGGIYVMGL